MASYVNTQGFQPDRYFARSWALFTREPGWFLRLFIFWIAGLVPIVGPVGVGGYFAEWSRLTAWGVETSPTSNGGTVGGYLRSGWRNVGIIIVWSLAWGALASLVAMIPIVGTAVAPIMSLAGIAFGIIVTVACVRAAIYQNIGGGFKVSTIWTMVERDPMGLLRIFGIRLVGGLILAVIGSIIFIVALVPLMGTVSAIANEIVSYSVNGSVNYEDIEPVLELTARLIVAMLPAMLITGAIASFFGNAIEALTYIATGLWTRQFNVPLWGDNDAPLPGDAPAYSQEYYPPQYPQQPYDPNAYQAPNQTPYAYGDTDYGTQTHGEVGQSYPNRQDNQYPPQG